MPWMKVPHLANLRKSKQIIINLPGNNTNIKNYSIFFMAQTINRYMQLYIQYFYKYPIKIKQINLKG